jgi:hypothetical protein
MDWKKKFYVLGLVLLCTGVLIATAAASDPAARKSPAQAPTPGPAGVTVVQERAAEPQMPVKAAPEKPSLTESTEVGAAATAEATGKDPGPDVDDRACNDCTTSPQPTLDPFPVTAWAGVVSGNCGTEGKWYAPFTGYAGTVYYFDLCPDTPGAGTANFDIDIAIVNSACTILAGQDGSCTAQSYRPNNFSWTCPANGTYFVKLAPYRSYNQHNCTGTVNNTFTMYYYQVGPCNISCQGHANPEPCGTHGLDDGCNITPNAFNDLLGPYPESWCGTIDTYLNGTVNSRDTDWYRVTTTAWMELTWTVNSEFPSANFIISGVCGGTLVTEAAAYGGNCTPVSAVKCLPPGTYMLFVSTGNSSGGIFTGYPCASNNDYQATLSMVTCQPQYCSAGTTYCDEYIARVQFDSIDNATGCTTGGYANYTALGPALLYKNTPYPVTITVGTPYSSDYGAIWIDYDHSMSFEPSELIALSGSPGVGPYTGTITPPVTAVEGLTRMRVRVNYAAAPPACGTTTYGEVEDYTVNIQPAPELGACCDGATCTITPPAACLPPAVYKGNGSICTPNPCVGACCHIALGTCTQELAANCLPPDLYRGDGTLCTTPNICPAAGDECITAVPLSGTVIDLPFDTTSATTSNVGTHAIGKDIFYCWTADCTGHAMFDTCGSTFDTKIAVWDTCVCPPTTELAYNDDGGPACTGLQASVNVPVIAGHTYLVQVGGYSTANGPGDLSIVCTWGEFGACCVPSGCIEVYDVQCTGTFMGNGTTCSGDDCNGNLVDDACDIINGTSLDCNGNGVPDECDLIFGTSHDWDGNGIPDDCQEDCNGNFYPDFCDLPGGCAIGAGLPGGGCTNDPYCGLSLDCQPNGIPDECELTLDKVLCTTMVYDAGICDGVNGTRPTVGWDTTGLVDKFTVPQGGNGMKFKCFHMEILDFTQSDMTSLRLRVYALPTGSIPADLPSFAAAVALFDHTYTVGDGSLVITPRAECYPGAGAWDYDASGPGYNLAAGSYALLVTFPGFGAVNYWASAADEGMGVGYVWGAAVDAPSAAGMALAWNLKGGGGDCNANGIPDDCDIADCPPGNPACADCNNNGAPDSCDLAAGTSLDCNGNFIPDECDIGPGGASDDCNENGIPDECDIANDVSVDCQGDGIPDECQLGTGGGGGQLVQDPSMEAGIASPYWDSTSTNYGTVLCDAASCGSGGGTALPHTGTVWAWFGGGGSVLPEVGTLSQDVTIPVVANATLKFWLWIGSSSTLAADTFVVQLGGNTIFSTDASSTAYTAYTEVTIDVTAYANGGTHTLLMTGQQTTTTTTNFNVDDITITVPGSASSNDCNQDGVPDECNIAITFGGYCDPEWSVCSTDYNGNGVPDECELCGDFTGPGLPQYPPADGAVDAADYWYIHDGIGFCLGHPKYDARPLADMDGDGCITLVDYQNWLMCYRMANGKEFVPPKKKPKVIEAVPLPSGSKPGANTGSGTGGLLKTTR